MPGWFIQDALGIIAGGVVGFSLGLVGGGGSILAVPLMVYVVGVPNPHVAIGTSAIAVAANAAVNLSNHARGGTVVWSCALLFAAAGSTKVRPLWPRPWSEHGTPGLGVAVPHPVPDLSSC